MGVATTFLVAEDETIVARCVAKHLRRFGSVGIASSKTQAIDAVATTRHTGIVLDIDLGDGNGLDVLERPDTQRFLPAILVHTGLSDHDGLHRHAKQSADMFVTKPAAARHFHRFARFAIARDYLPPMPSGLLADEATTYELTTMWTRILALQLRRTPRSEWGDMLECSAGTIQRHIHEMLARINDARRTRRLPPATHLADVADPILERCLAAHRHTEHSFV